MVYLWLFSVLRDILTWSRAVLRDNEDADYGSVFSFEPDTHNLKEVRGECMSLKSARSCQLSGREPHSPRQLNPDGAVAGGRANDAEHLGGKLMDCGTTVFDNTSQDVHAGGSGCGCSAITLCGYLLDQLNTGKLKKILFCGTGALLSPTSTQQGLPIPGVCHAVSITGGR